MPLPKPHSGESQDDFISRCMGDEVVIGDFPDKEQRLGVCFSQWREVHGGEPPKSMAGETKAILAMEVKSEAEGEIEAVFARFETKDLEGDWTLPGAFEDGAKVRISAHEHASWAKRGGLLPVGRGVIKTTDSDARLVGRFFLNTAHGRDTFETIKALDELQEWSYGYDVLERGELTSPLKSLGVKQVFKRLYVHEVSPAFRAVGVGTGTVSLKAYTTGIEELEAREAERAKYREAAEHEFIKFAQTRRRLGY